MIRCKFFSNFDIARIHDLYFTFGVNVFQDRVGRAEDGVSVGGIAGLECGVDVGDFGE